MRSGPGQPGKPPRDFGDQGYDPNRGGKPRNPQQPPKGRYPPHPGHQGYGLEEEEYYPDYESPQMSYPGSGKYPGRGQGQPRGPDAGRYYGGQFSDPQDWDESLAYSQPELQGPGQYYAADRQSQYPSGQRGYQNYPKQKPRGTQSQGYVPYQGSTYPQQPPQNPAGKGGFNKPAQKGGKNPTMRPQGMGERYDPQQEYAGTEYMHERNPQRPTAGDWSQQSMNSMGKLGPNQFGDNQQVSDQSSSQKKQSSNSLNPQSQSKKSGQQQQTSGNKKLFGEYITYEQFEQKKKAGEIPEISQQGAQGQQQSADQTGTGGPAQQIGAHPVQPVTQEGEEFKAAPEPLEQKDQRFLGAMAKLNTLDRGTYFIDEKKKVAHFLVQGRSDLLGWKDIYMINGYLLNGVIIKLLTLTSRIFLFIENLHPLYKEYIKIGEDGETALWTDKMPDKTHIVTVTNIEKVEVHDNDEEGFEGFVCYTVCEDSKIEFTIPDSEVDNFNYVQELILLYEPTSIRKIYIDVIYNTIYKPESKGFTGRRIAAIINPNNPGQTITYGKSPVTAINKICIVGSLWIQNGRYTLIAETLEHMQRLESLLNLALDIAEELGCYVMITNLRRTYDYGGKTVLYIGSDPTLKLIKSNNQITFAAKNKQSDNLIPPASQSPVGQSQGSQHPASVPSDTDPNMYATTGFQGSQTQVGGSAAQPSFQAGQPAAANQPPGQGQQPGGSQ
jgi:hypothetical protein